MGDCAAAAVAGRRVYRNHHLDSTRWDHVPFRDGDIVVTTPYKTGTTWTQRILTALLHGPDAALTRDLSPWVDARFWGPIEDVAATVAAQDHRRFMKSHLPLDGTRWDERVRYVVVGRDLRDVFMSLVNHYAAYGETAMQRLNDPDNPGAPIPPYPGDAREFWRNWINRGWFDWEQDGWPFWSAFDHLATWWQARECPNVLFVHYADLQADARAEVARLAAFLGIERTDDELRQVVAVSAFDRMKQDFVAAEAAAGGPGGSLLEGGMATFIHKGTNGRWRDVLTDEDLDAFERRASSLDPQLRAWLERGRAAVEPSGAPAVGAAG